MIELLATYSLSEIVAFLVTFALAIKGLVSFWDWAIDRIRKVFKKESQKDREKQLLEERLIRGDLKMKELSKQQEKTSEQLESICSKIDMLISSDKDSIKSYITKEHHIFVYQKGWIDDYSLDCIEKRFQHYRDEGGNSFVEDLMDELRELPKRPPQDLQE